jgi:phosphoserine phosphatase RsbU/P
MEGGLFLGAIKDVLFVSGAVDVTEGDLFFFYTDGLSEAMRSDDEMFGEERIKNFLTANRAASPDDLLERLEREVELFLGDAQLGDDFTLLAATVLRQTA